MSYPRIKTYAALDQIAAADLNAIQDQTITVADALSGTMASRVNMRCDAGTALVVYPIRGLWIGGKPYSTTALQSVALAGTLTAGHWHYVYAQITSSALVIEVSAADFGPSFEGGYVWKDNGGSPDVTRRYLGCIRARTNDKAYPFRMAGGRYTWRRAADSLNTDSFELTLASSGAATMWSDVDCSAFVPPHATLIALDAEFKSRSANDDVAEVCSKGDAAQAWRMTARSAASTNVAKGFIEIPVAGAPLGVSYQVSNSSDALRLFANGFTESV